MKRWHIAVALVLAGAGLALAALVGLNRLDEAPVSDSLPPPAEAAQVARGAYLARAGNCMGCHTQQGGAPYAGGRAIETPFGLVHAPNLTPDPDTGLGRWSADHFWRALHHGRSRDGRLLYPAFPYPEYTHVTRADADDLYAFLRSLPPVAQVNRPHALAWPYGSQAALAVWRALYFRPDAAAVTATAPSPATPLERGRYLVSGLGHCAACHGARNALGGPEAQAPWGGYLLPGQRWYAPALDRPDEAGVARWSEADTVALLQAGVNRYAMVSGPMAEVVFQSTQHLSPADLSAMAAFLRGLPEDRRPPAAAATALPAQLGRGAKLYEQHCVQCHGADGQGQPGAYPALAGNRAVTLAQPANLIRVVLAGGYPPATPGNPQPHGMPPYRHQLTDDEVAAVLSYIRSAWGNRAGPVTALDLLRDP